MPKLQLPIEQSSGSPSHGLLAVRCIANGYTRWREERLPVANAVTLRSGPPFFIALTTPTVAPWTMVSMSTDRRVSPSRITFPQEARKFAESHGAKEGADVLCRLALEMVPGAEHVAAEVIHDPEDGESSLHVTVCTSAEADEVVEAEENLYDALFNRVDAAGLRLLSLGYDFRG